MTNDYGNDKLQYRNYQKKGEENSVVSVKCNIIALSIIYHALFSAILYENAKKL